MAKQNAVAVAVKTALVSFDSVVDQFLVIAKDEKLAVERKFGANQKVADLLNGYMATNHGILNWETHHVRSPATQFQRIVKDTYDALKKRFDAAGYTGFANKFSEAKKYAPAMRLEGEAREVALKALQAKRNGTSESRPMEEVYSYRMKDGKREWGELASLYRKTARLYFTPSDDKKLVITEKQRQQLWKTMASLKDALKIWGVDADLVTAEK